MVAVLLTTCIISGTYAKYTTEDSAKDEARVAKWGVALQVAGTLYGGNYDSTDHLPQTWSSADAISVSANSEPDETATLDVVAPGTLNDKGMTFSLNGVPEVSGVIDAIVSYENVYLMAGEYGVMIKKGTVSNASYDEIMANTDDSEKLYVKSGSSYSLATAYDAATEYYTLEDYVDLTADYYPVEYQLDGDTPENVGFTDDTASDTLAACVDTAFAGLGTPTDTDVTDGKTTNKYQLEFVPSTDLDSLGLGDATLTWKWDFENGTNTDGADINDSPDGNDACDMCKADTILGNLQAGETTALNGEVVKNTSGTWAAPEAATGSDAKDYNLETNFAVDIIVTQVD
jgi:hypothetical protein